MQSSDFQFLSTKLKELSGLSLSADKDYLLETRLQPIARKRDLADIPAYVAFLRANPGDKAAYTELTEAMTTNESMFFRDNKPFEFLKNLLLPELKEKLNAKRSLKVWNAACSNGQEAYSVAMTLKEQADMLSWRHEIIGTDIDRQVLEKAADGVYTQFEVQRGLPIQMLLKYFKQGENNTWLVNDELKSMVKYKPLNLLDNFISMGKFDIIFCRNVLIYFDEAGKKAVLDKLYSSLEPHGYLLLGSAETVIGLTDKFKPLPDARGVFVRS